MYATTTAMRRMTRSTLLVRLRTLIIWAIAQLNRVAPVGDLLMRLYVAQVFWASGMAKAQSFDTTVLLFEHEYMVPILPPAFAAALATVSEIGFSALLALGLAGRASAGALFVLNLVAVISYPALMGAAIEDHRVWGLILLVLFLRGPGKASIDYFVARRFGLG